MFTAEHLTRAFEYLVKLRDSGGTNMWAAPEFMARELRMDLAEAKDAFFLWQDVVDDTLSIEEQVKLALERAS